MIELRHVRHLLAVTSYPTVRAAAKGLHLSQPALTKSIARFEEELGAKLFDRGGRRLVLTELGERLVERGDDLLRHARELEEEVALWKGIGTGEVAIGVDPESELGRLPTVLEAFMPAHPGIKLAVRSGHTDELLPALLSGDLHFLVADSEFALERDDLEIQALGTDPIVAAIRCGHPLEQNQNPNASDVSPFPLVSATNAPRFDRWRAKQGLRARGRAFAPSLRCDNYEVLLELAELVDAIVFGPRKLLEKYERAGRVRVMSWPMDSPSIQPSLIRSRGRILSPAAERLLEVFIEQDTPAQHR